MVECRSIVAALALAAVLSGAAGCGSEQNVTAGAALSPAAGSTAHSPSPSPSKRPAPTSTPRPTPAPTAPVPHPAVPPGWVGPFYPPQLHGYDVSYPQCPGVPAPAGAAFSIIGANDGRVFSANPCLREEWLTARGVRALYFNSGYDPNNAGKVTSGCSSRSQYQAGGPDRQTAYAIGCSAAVFAVNTLAAAGASRTVMIWLDVEQSNSWDLTNLDLNRTALQAEIDELAAYGRVVGLYGTSYQWHAIMGDWSPAGVVADWIAGQAPEAVCGTAGFSGHPVWVAQELDTWGSAGVDSDWTC